MITGMQIREARRLLKNTSLRFGQTVQCGLCGDRQGGKGRRSAQAAQRHAHPDQGRLGGCRGSSSRMASSLR